MLLIPNAIPIDAAVRRVAMAGGALERVDPPPRDDAERKRHRDINRALGDMQDRGRHFVERFRTSQQGVATMEIDLQHLKMIDTMNFPRPPRAPQAPRDPQEEQRRRLWRILQPVRDKFAALDEYELETMVEGQDPEPLPPDPPPLPPPLPPRVRGDIDYAEDGDDAEDEDYGDDRERRERRRMTAAIRQIEVYQLALFHVGETESVLRDLKERVRRRQGDRVESQQRRCFENLASVVDTLKERMKEFRDCFETARSSTTYDPRPRETVLWEKPRSWGFGTMKPRCHAQAYRLHEMLQQAGVRSVQSRNDALRNICGTSSVGNAHGNVTEVATPRKRVRVPHGGSHIVQ